MEVSIIIPVLNRQDETLECIQSIRDTTDPCEIVIIDNGSSPPFKAPFSGFHEIKVIRNEMNAGFPKAVNHGVQEAKYNTIVLLNNDVILTHNAVNKLIEPLNNGYSITGPVTNYACGMQKVQAGCYENINELYQEAQLWEETVGRGSIVDVNFVIGFCMAFKKNLWEEIGPFDDSLWPCSGEEIIFCLKAREAGHKVGIIYDCYVHHEGSQTFNNLDITDEKYNELCKRNDKNIIGKCGREWENYIEKQAVFPTSSDSSIRLNLGCGRFHLPGGFINIDQFESVNPDLVSDIRSLPFDPGSVDEIYAGHVLEHFSYLDGVEAIRYWMYLLKAGGRISICTPDYDYLVKQYCVNPSPTALRQLNDVYIYSSAQPSPHKYAYSAALLEETMANAGILNITRMPLNHPYFPEPVAWQCAFTGVKR